MQQQEEKEITEEGTKKRGAGSFGVLRSRGGGGRGDRGGHFAGDNAMRVTMYDGGVLATAAEWVWKDYTCYGTAAGCA